MSDTVWLAIIGGVVTLLTALIAVLSAVLLKRVSTVHMLVNSGMSEIKNKLADYEKRLNIPHSESDEKHAERKAQDAIDKPVIEAMNHPAKIV